MNETTKAEADNTLDAFKSRVQAGRVGCILCNGQATGLGVFVPDRNHFLPGQPVGKRRVAAYGICGVCFTNPDKTTLVEQRLGVHTIQ